MGMQLIAKGEPGEIDLRYLCEGDAFAFCAELARIGRAEIGRRAAKSIEVSVRASNTFANNKLSTIDDVRALSADEVRHLRGCGRTTRREVIHAWKEAGIALPAWEEADAIARN